VGLGAGKVQLLTVLLNQFMWPVAIGVAGAGIAAAASRVLRIALYLAKTLHYD